VPEVQWPWRRALVVGDSMRPTYSSGDVLLWRRGGRPLRTGDVVLVELPGGRPLGVKRLGEHGPDGWQLISDNPEAGTDSSSFGAVADSAVRGRVIGRLYRSLR
jgi:phage repressor protein C with HTH and peptisase S24 domain